MFKSNGTLSSQAGSLSLSCSSATASLHAVNSDGSISSEALSSSTIDAEGNYKLSVPSAFSKLSDSQIQYVVQASGCGSDFCRPVTDFKGQLITGASTLVCMASGLNGTRSLNAISRAEVSSALDSLNTLTGAATLLDLLNSVIANPSLANTYQTLTGVAAAKLKELPPSSVSYTAPLNIHESTANTYQVSINHWNSDYEVAYQWKLDGALVGSNKSYVYSPGQNAQGSHQLILVIGSKDSGGNLDSSKPVKSETFQLMVANDYPAIAPGLSLTSPVSSGLPISTRSLTLAINTGTSLSNCATFSKLALTENNSVAPGASDFSILCATSSSQSLAHILTSSGDGPKILRLWAMDAAGNISVVASTLSMDLDTAAPIAAITSTLPTITNSTSQSISFSANDNGGSIDHFECKLNSGSYTACSSPKTFSSLTQGTQTVAVRAIDTAGNMSADATASWVIDTTAPTLSFSATPNAVTNSLSSSFTFSGSDSGGGSIARYECKLDSGSYAICTSPKLDILAAGAHTLLVKTYDTAGNVSDVLSYAWTIDTTGPTTTISAKPASITNSANASFTFSGNDTGGGTVASFECSIDSGAYSVCVSPKTYSSLAATGHSFSVRAIDSAGNTGSSTTYSWTIDLSTPMASINSGPNSITNQTSATFTFSANPPPSGSIIGYQCSLDGAAYASCTSPATYNSLTQGSHTFGVKSVDNNSALSNAVTETWTIDTTLPVVTITSAPSGVNNSTTAAIVFSATDTGGGSVAGYECKLNSASYSACTSPVNLSGLAEDAYTYSIRATDTAGNVSSVISASWTVDLTPPTLSITSTPSSITNSQSAAFVFSATDSGGSSVASYQCSLDNAAFATCTSPANYSGLSANVHSFSVKVFDGTGNESMASSFSWTIDRTNPTVSITSAPNANANSTSANFNFSGSDTGGGAIASYECSIDAGSYSACVSPKAYSSLSQGSHIFNVRSLDTAGNTSTAASYTWNVDTVAPTMTITTPAADGSVIPTSSVSSFTVSGSCETGLNVVFSGASTSNTACSGGLWSASLNFSGLSDGTLSLTATQTDAAGNYTARTRTFIKDTVGPTLTLTSVPSTAKKGGSAVTIGFSVTEPNITTSQSFTVSYSSNNGSNWTNASSSVASTAGPLSGAAFTYSLTLPTADASQFKVRVSGVDAAGNSNTSLPSSSFIVDATPPTVTSLVVNDGATVALSPTLTMKINATDPLSGMASIRFADATGSNCQSSYADTNWQSFTNNGGVQSYSYLTGFSNGSKRICAWAKDVAGNVSEITSNSNAGTQGTDLAIISLDQGNPPTFSNLTVLNGTSASPNYGTTTFAVGDAVNISFTVNDDSALATNPISIYVTTDNSTYTQIASAATVGSPGSGQTTWSGTYNSYTATTTSYFKIKIIGLDANGNTAQIASVPLNSGKWSVFAGNSDIGDGSSALSSRIRISSIDNVKNPVVANTKNEIFIFSGDGLRKIDPKTGNITNYLKCGSASGIAAYNQTAAAITSTTSIASCDRGDMFMDGDDLYLRSHTFLYLVDTANNTIRYFLPSTATTAVTTNPLDLKLWIFASFTVDPVTKDIYTFNVCNDAIIALSSGATYSVKIQKITQNTTTKIPLTVSDFAGNCAKGSLVSGSDVLSTPLENVTNTIHYTSSLIYIPGTQALYGNTAAGYRFKIINNKIYGTTSSNDFRGGIYLAGQNKVYWTRSGGDVYSFTPTTADSLETVTQYIKKETECTVSTCRDDGTALSNATLMSVALFQVGGQLGVVDNSTNTTTIGRLRVLDSNTTTLQTLAGTDRFQGAGHDRTLARFSTLVDLFYKPSTTGIFSAGLYAADTGSSRILYMNPAASSIAVSGGSGISKNPDLVQTYGLSSDLSTISGSILYNLSFDSSGKLRYSGKGTVEVSTAGVISKIFDYDVTPSYLTMPEGSTSISYRSQLEHYGGSVHDSAGNFYFGGYQTTTASGSGYNRLKVKKSTGEVYTVIGTNVLAVSADCAVAGCAQSKSIYATTAGNADSGVNKIGRPYDDRYNTNEGRLLFSEDKIIRFVSKAYDPAGSMLGTLKKQDGTTTVDLTRAPTAFTFTYVDSSSEQIDRIYYISGYQLYCYKVSTGTDSNCTNASVGPGTTFGNLSVFSITMDASGNIYVINGTGNAIFKYSP